VLQSLKKLRRFFFASRKFKKEIERTKGRYWATRRSLLEMKKECASYGQLKEMDKKIA